MRSVAQPTRRGLAVTAVLAILLLVAVTTATPALVPMLVAGAVPMLAAPVIVAIRTRRAWASLSISARIEPAVVPAGAPCRLVVDVEDPGKTRRRWPLLGVAPFDGRFESVSIDQRLPERDTAPAPVWPGTVLTLPVGVVCSLRVETGRRGLFVLPPQPTWVRDPLGLFVKPGPPLPAVTVAVHPAPQPDGAWSSASATVPDADPLGELMGVRPYRPGDRLTMLHWPSRGRTGTWQVKHFRPGSIGTARVVVDDRASVHPRADYERMLGRALGAAEHELEQGRRVELTTLTGRVFVFDPLEGERRRLRRVVAGLDPRTVTTQPAAHVVGAVLTTPAGALTLPPGTGTVVAA